jgi:hypothetical protein
MFWIVVLLLILGTIFLPGRSVAMMWLWVIGLFFLGLFGFILLPLLGLVFFVLFIVALIYLVWWLRKQVQGR